MSTLHDTAVIKGMSKLGEKLERLPLEMKEKVARRSIQEAAKIGLAAIQTETPWRTGNLYRHLRIARRKDVGWIVTYVVFVKTTKARPTKKQRGVVAQGPSEISSNEILPYYWYFIEFGTSRMSPNPFMLRGFTKSADNAATRARDTAAHLLRDVY